MDLKVIVRGLWDRLGGWILIGLGALALLLGWLGVSDTAYTSEQIPYIVSGGLLGIALIGIGATLLISSDLRDEWRKLDDIEHAIVALAEKPPGKPPVEVEVEAEVTRNGDAPEEPAPRRRSRKKADEVPAE